METKVVTKEEAFKQKYLEDRIVILKPIPRGGKIIKDPTHTGYFMWEGASLYLSLPINSRGDLVNIFKSDEERKYFEHELDIDLSVHKTKNNFWRKFTVKITKDGMLMTFGKKFNMADPMDNLRVRVLKAQEIIAEDWDKRFSKGHYKFVLVDESHEENQAEVSLNEMEQVFTFFGGIKSSPKKMKDFLRTYLLETRSSKQVPEDAEKNWLIKEIKDVIDNDRITFLRLSKDDNLELKQLIGNAVKVGAIQKEGINKFIIPGLDNMTFSYSELVEFIKKVKEETDDIYIRIDTQVKNSK